MAHGFFLRFTGPQTAKNHRDVPEIILGGGYGWIDVIRGCEWLGGHWTDRLSQSPGETFLREPQQEKTARRL